MHSTRLKGILALVDQGLVSGASFLTTVFIGRICGDEQLGLFALTFTIIALAACAHYALIGMPYTVHAAELTGRDRQLYAGSVLAQAGLLAVICAAATALAALLCLAAQNNELARLIWVASAVIPLLFFRETVRRIELAHLRIGGALAIDAGVLILQISLFVLLVASGKFVPSTALLAVGLSNGIAALTAWGVSRNDFAFSRGHLLTHAAHNWRLGRWVFGETMTGALKYQSIPWAIGAMLGEAATGAYSACQSVISLSRPLLVGFSNFLIPKISNALVRDGNAGIRRVVKKSTAILATTMILFTIAAALLGDWAIRAIYGSEFAGLGSLIAVLAVGVALSAIGQPASGGLLALRRSELGFAVRLVGLTITMAVALSLIPSFGIIGAACGLAVGNGVGLVLILFSYRAALLDADRGAEPTPRHSLEVASS